MKRRNILSKNKKIIALFLALSFIVTIPQAADNIYATSAQNKKEEAQENLDDITNEIENLEGQQGEVEAELAAVRKKLSTLMDQQDALKAEIDTTQKEYDQTQLDLELAQEEAARQYEAMKVRIQYMYENSTEDNLWMAILESDGIADMLNRIEYISTIYETDKQLTEEYNAAVALVEEKQQELSEKMDTLLVKQETFLGQQVEIQSMIAELEDEQNEYASQIASAQQLAAEYKQTIAEQTAIIIKQQEEEARRLAEEKKKAEEVVKKEETNSNTSKPSNGSTTGEELVAYALQFVGNPYVWGGNSLTNGCDCSGFVHLIYKHFGYNTVRYSFSFLSEGVPVSRADIQPGDVVVYAANSEGIGHVAIYIGNGKIVEAQSTKAGITSDRSVDCRRILGIRRILK